MCIPRFDSPSIFGSLLGRHAGSFRISPTDVDVPVDTRYVPGTMIIETSWGTPTGWIVVRDALLMGPWHHDDNTRSRNHRRTPNDYAAEHILLRTVRCVSGEVQMVDGLRAGAGLRPHARALGPTPITATTRPSPRPRAATSSSP